MKIIHTLLLIMGLAISCASQAQVPSTSWVQTNGLPSGVIILVVSGTCPANFTEVSALNGKMLRGTVAANGDVGTTGGNATITPTGIVSTPTFTGTSNQTTSATSGGTPAGTNGTTTTGATSGGTPVGTISALTTGADSSTTGGVAKAIAQTPTFTGSALSTHTHTVPAEVFTGSALATHTHTLTPAGTVSQPTFTGNAVDPSPSYVKVIFCSKN
jgi:hypothetical protein